MTDRIDTLTLRLAGHTDGSARELADAVSAGLATRLGELGVTGHIRVLRLHLDTLPGESVSDAAGRIVRAVGIDAASAPSVSKR